MWEMSYNSRNRKLMYCVVPFEPVFPKNITHAFFSRKISAHEFERGGLLKPLVTTVDGTPTFLGDQPHATPSRPQRRSRHELRQLDEKELIFELVSKTACKGLQKKICQKF